MKLGVLKNWLSEERLWRRLRAQWRRAKSIAKGSAVHLHLSPSPDSKTLIIPCDPWSVIGSRGDEAMIMAVMQNVRASHPDRMIDIMTDDTAMHEECRDIGLNPIACWNDPMDVWFAAHAHKYAEVYILGADVTDGVYGWSTACKLLAYYDIFHTLYTSTPLHGKVHYLGFSWSMTPSPMMKRVMRELSPGLPLPVRDPVSYQRVATFTRHRPLVQVADVAFCLKPRESARVCSHRKWVEAQHQAGKIVVALNVHTMFNDQETKSTDWEMAFVDVLKRVQSVHPELSYLFLPHDNRPSCSDHAILKRLYSSFDTTRAYLVDEVMHADEIKSLIGSCDGLIAGRMHISIAALGQSVPVLGLVYQGKFEGLWQHFGLTGDTLIEPRTFLKDTETAYRAVDAFVKKLSPLRNQIQEMLPSVLELSRINFRCPPSPLTFT